MRSRRIPLPRGAGLHNNSSTHLTTMGLVSERGRVHTACAMHCICALDGWMNVSHGVRAGYAHVYVTWTSLHQLRRFSHRGPNVNCSRRRQPKLTSAYEKKFDADVKFEERKRICTTCCKHMRLRSSNLMCPVLCCTSVRDNCIVRRIQCGPQHQSELRPAASTQNFGHK